MEIELGKTAGFCFGVKNAVEESSKIVKENKEVCCLGELVHNKKVIEDLEKEGLRFINNVEEAKKNVIIRAHGEPISTYIKAKELNLNVYDLTCPKVLKIHKIAEEYLKKGYYIFLIGSKIHPETIGTISFCGENSNIIETEHQINEAIKNLYDSKIKKLLIIAQTTFSLEKFDLVVDLIKNNISNDIKIEIKNTICQTTKTRQAETEELAQKVDMMIVIGGKNSSNTLKLYEISKKHCRRTIIVEDANEINLKQADKNLKIGIMAGASTPKKSIDAVVEKLKQL